MIDACFFPFYSFSHLYTELLEEEDEGDGDGPASTVHKASLDTAVSTISC